MTIATDRATELSAVILTKYSEEALHDRRREDRDRLGQILAIFDKGYRGQGVDWDSVAERWLDLIRPAWYARLLARKRLRPLTLGEIRGELLGEMKLNLQDVFGAFDSIEALPPIEERVVSCIIGVE